MTSFTKLNWWNYGPGHTWVRSDNLRSLRSALDVDMGWDGIEKDRPTTIGEAVEIDLPILMWGDSESAFRDVQQMCDSALENLVTR